MTAAWMSDSNVEQETYFLESGGSGSFGVDVFTSLLFACLSSEACMAEVPRLTSSLFIVQICAANAACTSAACANIFDTSLSNIFIDCVTLCNANKTVMYPYANKTCVEVRKAHGACAIAWLSLFMFNSVLLVSGFYCMAVV